MKRIAFSANRSFIYSTLTMLCLAFSALMWKGVSSGLASRAPGIPPGVTATSAAAVPVVGLDVKDQEFPKMALIGEEFCYTARITNSGPAGMPGYGPYIRLSLPPELDLAGASLPGVSPTDTGTEASVYPLAGNDVKLVGTFPGSAGSTGTLLDPWSNTNVTGDSTFKLWLIAAPIGSLFTDEPPIDLRICLKLDMNAKLGSLLKVCHQPVYRYGTAATGNGAIEGAANCPEVMPVVVKLTKRAPNGPFSNKIDPPIETATGDCNPVTFQLVANIADGKTLTNLVFTDLLPPEMMLTADPITIAGAVGSIGVPPPSGFTFNVPTATGTTGKEDVIIEFKAFVKDILDETKCETKVVTNTAKLDGLYTGVAFPQQTDQLNIEAKHVALQKSAAGPNANPLFVMPGDMVTYTLSAQLSKTVNINFGQIVDKLPNGVSYAGGAAASINNGPFLPISSSNIQTDPNANTVTFNVGSFAACTKIVIRYKATVNEKYGAPISGQDVLASDPLLNDATMFYQIPNGGNTQCQDDAKGLVIVKPTEIEKKLLTPQPPDGFTPGDSVTFQLKMCVPSGDAKDIELTDYLPAPIFNAAAVTAGDISFSQTPNVGANYTFNAGTDNSIKFKITPSVISTTASQPVCFEFKLTVKVTTDPFVDDLFLTNLLQSKNVNTQNRTESHLTGIVIRVRAPKLMLTKGVFSSNNQNAVVSPTPSPTQPNPPVDGNVTGVDLNDKITFYLTVFNMGGASAYEVKVEDFLPVGWMYVGGMAVTGPTPAFTTSGTIGTGLTVTATYPVGTPLPAGQSWVIKIEAMLPGQIPPCMNFENKSQVTWKSAVGATSFPVSEDAKDSAFIQSQRPAITKTITHTNVANTTGNNVAIGEFVTYEIKIQVPEGSFPGVTVTENLPPGMSVIYTLPPTATADAGITPGSVTGVIGTGGQSVTFNFGTVTNANTNNQPSFITFTIGAVVLNTAGNVNGTMLTNTVNWNSSGCSITATAPPLKIVEPKLKVTKVAKGANGQPITTADAGDTITYEITIMHDAASTMDAFVAALSDLIPPGQTYKPTSLMHIAGLAPDTNSLHEPTGPTDPITATWSVFPLGSSSTIKFSTMVNDTVRPCTDLTNRATVTWTSLPGGGFPPEPRPLVYFGGPNFCPRTGNPGGCGVNNYIAASAAVLAVPGPKITKSVLANDNEVPGTVDPDVTIGEFIVYKLRIELPEGTTPSLLVKDFMPVGLRVHSVNRDAVTNGSTIPLTSIPVPTVTPTIPQTCPGGGTITINFGSISVPVDGNPSNNFFHITVIAEVCDIPAFMGMPGNQTMLTNYATVQIGQNGCESRSNDVTMKIVEPKLTLRKSFDVPMANEGDTVTITLSVTNTGLSDAYFVNLEDPLPTAIFGNVVEMPPTPTGFVFSAPVVGPNTVATFTGGTVPKGQTLSFKIKATIKRRCLEQTFNNKATIVRARTMPPPPPPDQTIVAGSPEQQQPQPPPRLGRDVSGAMATAPLTIKPGRDCECYQLSDSLFGSLVEWLRFNEASGDNALDSASFLNHGKLKPDVTNGPKRVGGAVGGALNFDGINDYVEVQASTSLNIGTGSVTVDAWIKPTAESVGPNSGIRPIVDKRTGTGNIAPGDTANGYALFLVDGQLSFQLGAGNYFNYISTSAMGQIQPNVWSQVTGVVTRGSGSFSVELFVNGQSVYSVNSPAINGNANNTAPLFVGRRHPLPIATAERYFTGEIDEVEIFTRALTEPEIQGIVRAGSKGKCRCVPPPQNDKMIGWWPLDSDGTDIRGGMNGTVVGTGGSFPPAMVKNGWRSGGIGSLISVPASNTALNVKSFTIDSWVIIDALNPANMPIVYKGNPAGANISTSLAFGVTSAGDPPAQRLVAVISNGTTAGTLTVKSTADLPLGVPLHVAVTVNVPAGGLTDLRLYVNGVQAGSGSANVVPQTTTFPLQIGGGAGQTPPNGNFFNGIIDEVEMWNVALSQPEIESIFLAGGAGKCRTGCAGVTLNLNSQPNPLPMGMIGMPFPATMFTASGGTAPYMYSATGLPPGLTLSMDGKLTGTPTQQGNFTIVITVKDANGCTAEFRQEISVKCREFNIRPDFLPAGFLNTAYPKQTFTTDSTCPPVTYTVSGNLPPGMTFANGMLQGTPTQTGTFNFTVAAVDACGCPGRKTYSLIIRDCPRVPLNVFNTGVDNNKKPLNVGMPDGHYSASSANGSSSVLGVIQPQQNWVMSPSARWIGRAEPGFNRFSTTFNLSGCDLTSVSISGRFAANTSGQLFLNGSTLIATSNGPTAFTDFNITSGFKAGPNTLTFVITQGPAINGLLVEIKEAFAKCCECKPLLISPTVLPAANHNQAYAPVTLTGNIGLPPYTFSIIGGALPLGMTLSAAGVISGTPIVSGGFTFKVLVVDGFGCIGTVDYSLTVRRRQVFFTTNVVQSASLAGGPVMMVNVMLAAAGNERRWRFSVMPTPGSGLQQSPLSNPRAMIGPDAAGGQLTVNNSQIAQNTMGLEIAMPAGQTLKEGSQHIFTLMYDIAPSAMGSVVNFDFFDNPVPRAIYDVDGNLLDVEFLKPPAVLARAATSVSAASYRGERLAPEEIVAVFGNGLATATQIATTLPLPTQLAGTSVKIRDSKGVERPAPLFFVAPTQVNYLIPAGTAEGLATVLISSGDGTVSGSVVEIANVAPGLFVADASGRGLPAASALLFKADGTQSSQPVARFDTTNSRFVAVPIDLGTESDRVFLSLFGTGVRKRSSLENVRAIIGGVEAPVLYAGEQGGFAGLDQINLELPRALAGSGLVNLTLIVDGRTANIVQIHIQ